MESVRQIESGNLCNVKRIWLYPKTQKSVFRLNREIDILLLLQMFEEEVFRWYFRPQSCSMRHSGFKQETVCCPTAAPLLPHLTPTLSDKTATKNSLTRQTCRKQTALNFHLIWNWAKKKKQCVGHVSTFSERKSVRECKGRWQEGQLSPLEMCSFRNLTQVITLLHTQNNQVSHSPIESSRNYLIKNFNSTAIVTDAIIKSYKKYPKINSIKIQCSYCRICGTLKNKEAEPREQCGKQYIERSFKMAAT